MFGKGGLGKFEGKNYGLVKWEWRGFIWVLILCWF